MGRIGKKFEKILQTLAEIFGKFGGNLLKMFLKLSKSIPLVDFYNFTSKIKKKGVWADLNEAARYFEKNCTKRIYQKFPNRGL